jgi:hypothetical protein
MDPNSLGEDLSPHDWATDVVCSITALLPQWRVLVGVCPRSALLWCRVGLLVMICGWSLMFAWNRDLPATRHCLGCAWVSISPLVHNFWLLFHLVLLQGRSTDDWPHNMKLLLLSAALLGHCRFG